MNGAARVNARDLAIEAVHQATAIYTVDAAVDRLLDRLDWPTRCGTLLDPAAGDGAFLVRALARLPLPVDDLPATQRVRGYEFHPGAVRAARLRIADHLISRGWSCQCATAAALEIVLERDFLLDGPADGTPISTISANPPYLRASRLPDYFKLRYRSIIRRHALNDLLHAFLDKCVELVPNDGAIGMVCADRFLFNESAADLRVELGRRVGLSHLARIDVTSSFYRAKTRRRGSLPRVHPVEIVLRPSDARLRPITAEPIFPSGAAHESTGQVLGDVANVRLGPWLGPAGIFVVDEPTALLLGDADLVPAVDTDDIDPTTDRLGRPRRFAIRTLRETEPAGAVRDHLKATTVGMPPRGRKTAYWVPPETITLPLDQEGLLVPRIARRIRAIALPPGTLPINHNLNVVSRSGNASLSHIREILTCKESQDWLQHCGSRLESGYFSVSARMLRRLPVPARLQVKAEPQ